MNFEGEDKWKFFETAREAELLRRSLLCRQSAENVYRALQVIETWFLKIWRPLRKQNSFVFRFGIGRDRYAIWDNPEPQVRQLRPLR